MIKLLAYFTVYLFVLITAEKSRVGKLLNVFNIVTFPNDPCQNGDTYGSCYTASECTSLGGNSLGSCASGFGVCCTKTGGCDGSTSLNNSYFTSSSGDTSPCSYTVCKSEANVCQIRLDFDTFVTESPNTESNSPLSVIPTGRTQCLKSQFWVTSDAGSSPTICGTNTGYHMIVSARDDCNILNHYWTEGTPSYTIRISQISCTADWRPPQDCLQWFTGTSGYIYSYNYAGGYHLANQDYTNCIRTEQGYCSITYTAVSTTSFQLSGQYPPTTATSIVGETCSQDYIMIQRGGSCPGPDSTTLERFCGSLLAEAAGTTTSSVCTSAMPFMVGVKTDGTEVDGTSPDVTEYSKGFYIYYTQTAC